MPDAQPPNHGSHRQELADRLAAEAERVWGADRAGELAPAIRDASETLARVAAVPLTIEDAEPDFIR